MNSLEINIELSFVYLVVKGLMGCKDLVSFIWFRFRRFCFLFFSHSIRLSLLRWYKDAKE